MKTGTQAAPPAPSNSHRERDVSAPTAEPTDESTEPAGAHVVYLALSGWAVARYTLVVALVLGGLYVLWRIQEVIILLLLAIIFATAIEPIVNRLRRGPFSRGQGILIVYSGIFVVVAGIGLLFVPGLIDQALRFVEALPDHLAALRPLAEQIGFRPLRQIALRALGEAQPAVARTLSEPTAATEPTMLVSAGGAFAHTLFSTLTVFLLAYYWLVERAMIKRAVLRLAPPSRAHQINATWLIVEARLGGWVRGQLLVMFALGLMAGLAFLLLGLPNPLLLAVLAGLFEIIPIIGPFLAFLPAMLVALATDPTKALILIPVALAIQQIEGNILIPRVMSHSVGISPLTVILGILIGSLLYGPAGAFLAVPVAAAVQAVLNETLRPALEEEGATSPLSTSELEASAQSSTQPS